MKLVKVYSRHSDVRKYTYSIWFNYSMRSKLQHQVYGVIGPINFKLLFKLQTITGDMYMESEDRRYWHSNLEHDKLYKEFVENKRL